MQAFALLATALLFGGMVLYAFGFAAFVFSALPAADAGALIRRAFPHFYLFVMGTALIAAGFCWPVDRLASALLAVVALSTLPTRQVLMPSINQASDQGDRGRFKRLHTLSVLVTLGHIALAAWVLIRFLPPGGV